MGMLSRYVERLTARLRGRRPGPPAVSADAEGLRVGAHSIAWVEVRRLDAFKRDAYVGDALCLAILGPGDRVFEIGEASPGWEQVGDAIERYLPGSLAHVEWKLRLIAAAPGQSVAVYPIA